MNALRHFLRRGGVATHVLWGLILVVLLARALISSAVMLDPDAPDAGTVVLCSGHGPLVLGTAAPGAADFAAGAPITPANDAFALVDALTHHAGHGDASHSSGSSGTSGGGELCPFGAALFTALAASLLLVLLFPAAFARQDWPRRVVCAALRQTIGDRPPSRAPPRLA